MKRERRSLRLTGYDYSQNGYYFVTICVKDRQHCLGEIKNENMMLNDRGRIVQQVWGQLPDHYTNCCLDEFIIMSNHVHGIGVIKNVGTGLKPAPAPHGLSEIVRAFKTFSSRRINEMSGCGSFQWQRGFHYRIISNENELNYIREYIHNNPLNWEADENN